MFSEWLHERRLYRTRRQLKDAVHDLDKWSFADSPSQHEDRMQRIYRLIRKYETLGGETMEALPWDFDWLAHEAMPETFERVRDYGRWKVRRKEEVNGESIPETDDRSTSSP